METHSSLAKKISETYEKGLFSLDLSYQAHFACRKWRITGQEKYISPVFYDFQIKTLRIIPWFDNLENQDYRQKEAKKILLEKSPQSQRLLKRKGIYEKNLDFVFYHKLLVYLFSLRSYRLERILESSYQKAIIGLQKVDFKTLLADKDLIVFAPSFVANTLYYLQFLKIVNLENELKPLFYQTWQREKVKEDWRFFNKIYAFTHLIIAASYFYQRFVSPKSFRPFLDFFELNYEEIIKRTNPDIIGEVGLCFKLAKKPSFVITKTQEQLFSYFSPRLGYIPRKQNDNPQRAEHRNIVAIMFLSSYSRLYKGPDLVNFMKKNKKSFYLPQKGKLLDLKNQLKF